MNLTFEQLRLTAQRRPHGVRARYSSGCRCMLCRAANSRYEVERDKRRRGGEWNGLIDVSPVVEHVRALSEAGVGYKTVADVAGCSTTTIALYLNGSRTQIRAQLARRILAVDRSAVADGALIPSSQTWKYLDELLEGGYTRKQLAKWLGCRTPALQIRRGLIKAETAGRVRRMYELIQQGKLRRDR